MDAVDIYGLSEIMGPGVANECVETKDGLHVWEDHFYPEIIDPETGAVLPDGEMGELVFTTLTKEGLPMIRYRTRDLTRLLPGTARSMRRMEKITGRSDDMIILRGVNVFPTQIEEQILKCAGPRAALPDRADPRRAGWTTWSCTSRRRRRRPTRRRGRRRRRSSPHHIKSVVGVSTQDRGARPGRRPALRGQGEAGGGQPAEAMSLRTRRPLALQGGSAGPPRSASAADVTEAERWRGRGRATSRRSSTAS